MHWFKGIFIVAIVVSLVTRKAFFRGFVRREKDPRQYWLIVSSYVFLALITTVIPMLTSHGAPESDGAIRIANDIELGAQAFRKSENNVYTIQHTPVTIPSGCAEFYSVEFSQNAALTIWCKMARTQEVQGSHSTQAHLKYVKVPKSLSIEKTTGQPLFIDLEKVNGELLVKGLR